MAEVSPLTLVYILGSLISAFVTYWGLRLERRTDDNAADIRAISKEVAIVREIVPRVEEELAALNDKVDRLLERTRYEHS